MKTEAQKLIEKFDLQPHPEGGYFQENYRSEIIIAEKNLPVDFGGRRSLATSILFLLPQGTFSAFHKLKQDEIWYYHGGNGPIIHCIYPDGTHKKFKMGLGLEKDEQPQLIIPAGTFFASVAEDDYGFCGCVVTPGFDFADFNMPTAAQLIKIFQNTKN
jgi:predicted cupin superfamily sugar epimerase